MTIPADEIHRVAELARLQLQPEEEELYGRQLARIVEYIDQLEKYPTDSSARAEGLRERSDDPRPSLSVEEFLENAPEKLHRFLIVPRVKKVDGG